MSSQQLDEEAIFEVAREIQNPMIRAKYLSQVCHDERLLGRLEGRLMTAKRRWQFSLRTLLIVVLLGGALLAGIAGTTWQAVRAEQAERVAVQQARRSAELARLAELAAAEAAVAKQEVADLRQSGEVDSE